MLSRCGFSQSKRSEVSRQDRARLGRLKSATKGPDLLRAVISVYWLASWRAALDASLGPDATEDFPRLCFLPQVLINMSKDFHRERRLYLMDSGVSLKLKLLSKHSACRLTGL